MTAVAQSQRAAIHRWQESAIGVERVDRETKVIRGARILGLESRNGRTYREEAASRAIPLYEGAAVYIDHGKRVKPGEIREDRSLRDRWAVLRNVRKDDQGLVGDLHYLESDPMTPKLLEMAEEYPETFGLSHDANGSAQRDATGNIDVSEITKVNSVDIVCDPATTVGLFESLQESLIEEEMSKKRIKLRESIRGSKSPLIQPIADWLKNEKVSLKLREMVGDQDVEEVDEADEEKKPSMDFQNAVEAVLKDEGTPDVDKLAAIREMVGAAKMQEMEDDDEAMESEDDKKRVAEAEAEKEKMTQESRKLKQELDSLRESLTKTQGELDRERTEKHCRSLLESAEIEITDARLGAMMRAEKDADRRSLIESWPTIESTKRRPGVSRGVSFRESFDADSKLPENADELRKALR